jgi:general secretion pathway protein L
MTTASVLDADMTTVLGWARNGASWWVEELGALVPARLGRLGSRPLDVAHYADGRFSYARRGAALPGAKGPVAVTLPATAALQRTIAVPPLGSSDLQRLVTLEAERLLPFAPGTAVIAFEAGPLRSEGQSVTLAGLPLASARTAIEAAATAGLDVRRLGLAADDGVRFDFLPALNAAALTAKRRARLIWWGIAAAALAVLVGVFIAHDVRHLEETRALVEAHGQTAATARLLRARVIAEDARRRTLLADRGRHDPLPVLAAVTKALPDSVWVQRFSFDGQDLRLGGFKPASVDVVALLRQAPAFSAVRNTAVEMAPTGAGASQPFEVVAERR